MLAMIAFISTCVFVILLLVLISRFLYKVWWTPIYIQYVMRSQGIKGPSYKFFLGNAKEMFEMRKESICSPMELSHFIYPRVLPHVYSWMKLYGKNFLCWLGPRALLVVTETDMIREVLNSKDGAYQKNKARGFGKKLVGDGLGTTRGEKWIKLRKLANHSFHAERLKYEGGSCFYDMVPKMTTSTDEMLERWRHEEGKEIDAYDEFKILTSEIISRTAFGSSYLEGKSIFGMITDLLLMIVRNDFQIRFPGAGKLYKSVEDIKSDQIADALRKSVIAIIEKRERTVLTGEAESFGSDFLGALIQASHEADRSKKISVEEVIDECVTFYTAGQETTNTLLAWIMFLLATHQDWQEKARNEVLELFGQDSPNWEGIPKLKIISMIINETLRLYSPASLVTRRVERKTRLGKITVPENADVWIPILALHHDPEIWGQDAHLFKPERFAEGIAKATKDNPMAFIPFGFGPRNCVGMSFSTIEAKIALSKILQRYKFTLSPTYVHSPIQIITVRPQHGVQIMLQKM